MHYAHENHFKAALAKRLRAQGCEVLAIHGHGRQTPGWPDVFACRGGLPDGGVWIEAKRHGGQLRTAQSAVARNLVAGGAKFCTVETLHSTEPSTFDMRFEPYKRYAQHDVSGVFSGCTVAPVPSCSIKRQYLHADLRDVNLVEMLQRLFSD